MPRIQNLDLHVLAYFWKARGCFSYNECTVSLLSSANCAQRASGLISDIESKGKFHPNVVPTLAEWCVYAEAFEAARQIGAVQDDPGGSSGWIREGSCYIPNPTLYRLDQAAQEMENIAASSAVAIFAGNTCGNKFIASGEGAYSKRQVGGSEIARLVQKAFRGVAGSKIIVLLGCKCEPPLKQLVAHLDSDHIVLASIQKLEGDRTAMVLRVCCAAAHSLPVPNPETSDVCCLLALGAGRDPT